MAIPTTIEEWPEGDALVGNFVYKDGKLVGLIDTKALISNDSKSTTIPYDCVDVNLSSIYEWGLTVHPGPRCKHLNIKWNQPDVSEMNKYKECKTVDDVKAVDADFKTSNIVDGVWYVPLSDLTDAKNMFSMTSTLTSFYGDLSNLEDGTGMFYACTKLSSFKSNLSKLTKGGMMFYYCKLDTASIKNIAETINTPTENGRLDIKLANSTPNEEEIAALDLIVSKNWTVMLNNKEYTPSA